MHVMKNNRGCIRVALIPKDMEINNVDGRHTHRAICVMHITCSSQESIGVRVACGVDILLSNFPNGYIYIALYGFVTH